MSISRILRILTKDLRMSPRSPTFLFVIIMPILITFLMKVVFVALLTPVPRLGIADLGESEVAEGLRQVDGLDLTLAESAAELRALVEHNDVDAGLVLAPNFDAAVRAGERPNLDFFVSGESKASNRVLLAFAALDQVRAVEGAAAPVEVVLEKPGGGAELPISKRLLPSILMFVLISVGIFFPAFMLVQEREHGTLDALLVTPVKMSEILLAKALLGFFMVLVMSVFTLAINQALADEPLALLVSIAVAALVCTEIGLCYGTLTRDAKTLYTLVKSLNIFFVGPVIFYIFPDWPRWIAKLFPTYWIIDPIYQVTLKGASLAEVWMELAIALAIGAVLLIPVVLLGRRMQVAG